MHLVVLSDHNSVDNHLLLPQEPPRIESLEQLLRLGARILTHESDVIVDGDLVQILYDHEQNQWWSFCLLELETRFHGLTADSKEHLLAKLQHASEPPPDLDLCRLDLVLNYSMGV